MTSKLSSLRANQARYFVAYFVLLIFSLSGLMLQGGVFIFVGVACWFSVVAGLFVGQSYLKLDKNLSDSKLKSVCYRER
jgi:hypothetical protein